MKRVKTVLANDGRTKARVTIELDSEYGGLTRDEQAELLENIASGTMQTLAGARYFNVSLSEIRVR